MPFATGVSFWDDFTIALVVRGLDSLLTDCAKSSVSRSRFTRSSASPCVNERFLELGRFIVDGASWSCRKLLLEPFMLDLIIRLLLVVDSNGLSIGLENMTLVCLSSIYEGLGAFGFSIECVMFNGFSIECVRFRDLFLPFE